MENKKGITIIGLGPGDVKLITRETWDWISNAEEIYLRTAHHPLLAEFPKSVKIQSFDHVYEEHDSFADVYEKIVDTVIKLGQRERGVTYAVPGHPFVAETTCPKIVKKAKAAGIPVKVMEAVSFLEPTFTALGLDPFPSITLMDALDIAAANFPQFPPSRPVLIAQVYSRMVAAELKQTLLEVFPDEHPVKLVHAAGTKAEKVEGIALYEIDRSEQIGVLTSLYIEPLPQGTAFEEFQEVIAHLRAPDGCPWDRKQDHQTLRKHLISETFELVAALDEDDPKHMQEELGDLLLQIVLHAQIGAEYGEFRMTDIIKGISDKLIRRHPHVFANLEVDGVDTVLTNWEAIKAEERKENGKKEENGLLSGVPKEYPALAQAQEIQDRAARVGFDWDKIEPVLEKVYEELDEVKSAEENESRAKELGDVLFAIVNLIRWYDEDAETLLRETNQRFRKRFNHVEDRVTASGKPWQDFALEQLDEFWEEAKKSEN